MSIDQQFVSRTDAQSIHSASAPGEGVSGEFRHFDNDIWYRISNVDRMAPFFMSLISSEDHWMYVASNGALTCGRRDANQALFPYYSADKLLDQVESTGPRTIIRLEDAGKPLVWEPFSSKGQAFERRRSLYKNRLGSRVIFEETNLTLGLSFRYQWGFSRRFGFVRHVDLVNLEAEPRHLAVLDGLENLLPPGLDQNFQLRFSNLADAYKRAELLPAGGTGVYYLNSIPTDRAEPSEGLLASVAWHCGADNPLVLLSSRQLPLFRRGQAIEPESEVRGQRHSYFLVQDIRLSGRDLKSWKVIADIGLDHADLVELQAAQQGVAGKPRSAERAHSVVSAQPVSAIGENSSSHASVSDELAIELENTVQLEVLANESALLRFASELDGVEVGRDLKRTTRHLANTMFNAMRGGMPLNGYQTAKRDVFDYLRARNRSVLERNSSLLEEMPEVFSLERFQAVARENGDRDLIRLAAEFLPLTFSRRHGDPTRPWNQFRINVRSSNGDRRLGYEGNWRDIFQNWEALGTTFPQLLPAMVMRFINASTADGYNPYRITDSGFDWERPNPEDPWSNIGYWGDHQVVYLSKLLERTADYWPESLESFLLSPNCVHADLPYRIAGYSQLCTDPRNSISFERELDLELQARVEERGSDGCLVRDQRGEIHYVSLIEKLLLTGLVKLANFVPGGGIWLNTQRPEWNDAQNALAGFGASLVSVCYLRRYLIQVRELLDRLEPSELRLSVELATLFAELARCYSGGDWFARVLEDDSLRRQVVDRLQVAGERYRQSVYGRAFGEFTVVTVQEVQAFLGSAVEALEATLRASRRKDGLYQSFNLLSFDQDAIRVEHLEEMLEGQVAILESGMLGPQEGLALLVALRKSDLFRPDQQSYLLYPNRQLPRFVDKNRIPAALAARSLALKKVSGEEADAPIRCDRNGVYHFAGRLRNADDLRKELIKWSAKNREDGTQVGLSESELAELEGLWERTFQHQRFTGRSTSFFAYEGLGSIYWHMVSKLTYAVARLCHAAHANGAAELPELIVRFREIYEGMWLHKSPEVYGAFPTDPYSHTPEHAGAQQPGMTGQVKEDLLTRQLELGVLVEAGQVRFRPILFQAEELLESSVEMPCPDFSTVGAGSEIIAGSFAFSLCQTQVLYRPAEEKPAVRIEFRDGASLLREGLELTREESLEIFNRTGAITKIEVRFPVNHLG